MELSEFFLRHNKIALAFSGGTDSAYLLYSGITNGADIHAYFVKSQFQPEFEIADARRLAGELGARLTVIQLDALSNERVAANPANRCYYCKQNIFSALIARARADGYDEIIDGTNASDDALDRPGMRALEEMKVLSPLRECGINKRDVRRLSREAGLFTWDKPSYACLATRIPSGAAITEEKLARIERAESALAALGFIDFRVRLDGDTAKLQMRQEQMPELIKKREEILKALSGDFPNVVMDMKARNI